LLSLVSTVAASGTVVAAVRALHCCQWHRHCYQMRLPVAASGPCRCRKRHPQWLPVAL
jgi:hypothetical protein